MYADAAVTGYQNYVGGITKAFVDTDTNGNILRGVFITKGKSRSASENYSPYR